MYGEGGRGSGCMVREGEWWLTSLAPEKCRSALLQLKDVIQSGPTGPARCASSGSGTTHDHRRTVMSWCVKFTGGNKGTDN